MTVAAGQNRQAHRIRRTGVGAPSNPQPGAPDPPSPVTTATPATLMIGWGGASHAYTALANYQTWAGWGFTGYAGRMGNNFLYGFGNNYRSRGTSAAAETDSSWNYMKAYQGLGVPALNGGATGLGIFKAKEAGIISWAGINVKMVQTGYQTTWGGPSPQATKPSNRPVTQITVGAPYAQWWDDVTWANVCARVGERAAMVNFLGGNGLVFDPEDQGNSHWDTGSGWRDDPSHNKLYDLGVPTGGHTLAQQFTQVEQRGYEFGTAIYNAFPNCDIIIYQWQSIPGAWQSYHAVQRLGGTDQGAMTNHTQFFYGMMRAHATANSQGRFLAADAWWYRYTSQWSGVQPLTALRWDVQGGMCGMSQTLPAATRNQIMPYLGITPMSWAGTDGTTNYNNSQESEPTWGNAQNTYRQYGMLGVRVEYNYADPNLPGQPGQGINAGLANNYAAVTGRLTRMQTAVSTTDNYSNVAPVVSASSSGSGSTRTISGTASHPLGISRVKVYLHPSGTPVHAVMTWNLAGGSATTGIDNSFVDWTVPLTGVTSGSYAIVTAYSSQKQEKSTVVGPL